MRFVVNSGCNGELKVPQTYNWENVTDIAPIFSFGSSPNLHLTTIGIKSSINLNFAQIVLFAL